LPRTEATFRLPSNLYHTNQVQTDEANRGPHVPLSDVSRPAAHSSILGLICFQPHCSTSAAINSLLHTVINLLQFNPSVVVISLDFSKAFDTIRHSTLLSKLAELDLPTPVYNWLIDFFSGHSHHTTSQTVS